MPFCPVQDGFKVRVNSQSFALGKLKGEFKDYPSSDQTQTAQEINNFLLHKKEYLPSKSSPSPYEESPSTSFSLGPDLGAK